MTNKVNSALDFLQEFDSVSWYQKELGIVLDYIIELEEEIRGWIPVSERLPEKAEASYWICTDGGYQCQCRWTNNVYGLGEGDRWAWKIYDIPQFSKVVAWMPLPEPYKIKPEIEQGLNFGDQDTIMPAT